MFSPLLMIHMGCKPYDAEGTTIAVCVEFHSETEAVRATSVAYRNWRLTGRWATTPDEAAYALEKLLRTPTDRTWIQGWMELASEKQWKALAFLRTFSAEVQRARDH